MTRIEYIYSIMKDVTNKTPVLLIGGAATIFKRLYKGNIYRFENTDDVKDFITNFYNVEYNKPIVIEDLSLLYRDSLLLKMIEEIKLPLIMLASEDNLSIPLYSRVKTCIKFPQDDDTKCNNISILEAQQHISEEELTGRDLDKYLSENCPDLAKLYRDVKLRKNKDKIIQIIGGIHVNRVKNNSKS